MTTFLIIGDPHIKTSNIPEVDIFIEKITKLATDKLPGRIIILGDTLDTMERIHTGPLNKAYEFINKMKTISKTYILVGNHDHINQCQFLTENHWLNGMKEWKNLTVVDKIVTEIIDEQLYVYAPYVPTGKLEEALNTCDKDWKKAKIIFCHQEFQGCKMGAIVSIDGDKWPTDYPEIISGHIHSNQTPQPNIYYPGSAMQNAFGESKKNIIAYVTVNSSKKYNLEEIDLKLPRKKIIYMDMFNLDTYEAPETTEEKLQDKIKLTISGNQEEFKSFKKTKKYKKLVEKGIKVVFKATTISKKDSSGREPVVVESKESDFSSILNTIVNNEKNIYLLQTYELVVNNKKIKSEDFMYI